MWNALHNGVHVSRFDLVICDLCGHVQPDRDEDSIDRVFLMCVACRGRALIYLDTPTEEEFREWQNNTTPEIQRQTELIIKEQHWE